MRWIKKMNDTFMMGTTSSITMQSLEKIVQRAPAVGAKMWCFSVGHALSPEHRAFVPQQSAKFRTAFFGQFRTSLRKRSVASYVSI